EHAAAVTVAFARRATRVHGIATTIWVRHALGDVGTCAGTVGAGLTRLATGARAAGLVHAVSAAALVVAGARRAQDALAASAGAAARRNDTRFAVAIGVGHAR